MIKDEQKTCRWIYRPGTDNSHWAMTTCKKGFNYLSKLNDLESYVGVANYYNGRSCPICGKSIKMDYSIIEGII